MNEVPNLYRSFSLFVALAHILILKTIKSEYVSMYLYPKYGEVCTLGRSVSLFQIDSTVGDRFRRCDWSALKSSKIVTNAFSIE